MKPRVHPSTNSTTAEDEAKRYALLDKSTASDLERTEEAVLKRFKTELDCVPLTLRQGMATEIPDDYWAAHYYEELQKILETKTELPAGFQSGAATTTVSDTVMDLVTLTPTQIQSSKRVRSPTSREDVHVSPSVQYTFESVITPA